MGKRKVKCKRCGAECCTCSGCNPSTYVNGLCPKCQKLENAVTTNKGVQELRQSEGAKEASRLLIDELS